MRKKPSLKQLTTLLLVLIMGLSLLFLPALTAQAEGESSEETAKEADEESKDPFEGTDFANWDEVLEQAKGTTVTFYGWGGSDQVNAWIDDYLAPYAEENYGIKVDRVPMDIDMILNKLAGEKSADQKDSSIDLIWINGENFATAKENDFLYGPFTEMLPHYHSYVDLEDPEVQVDFATEIEGFESPYSKAQLVLLADTDLVKDLPSSAQDFMDYAKANPGTFTYAALPDFTSSAFVRTIVHELADYDKLLEADKEISKEELAEIIKPAMDYLKELAPYLWEKGKTYPATTAEVDQMFMDGQLHFSMSYDQNHAVSMIRNGQYPETATAFIFDQGTVGNTSYVAIGKHSQNIAGALCLADAILSPEMQASKMDPEIWGTIPVLDYDKLDEDQLDLFAAIEMGEGALPADDLLEKRVPELPAFLVPLIEEIWLDEVAGQ